MQARLDHIDTWIFDLDNTLYPPSDDLFSLMDEKMENYLGREYGLAAEDAARLRHEYWQEFGSTLVGLMQSHGTDPAHFLYDVHDIDLGHMREDADLARAISDLPGRKIVYTNGSQRHAERVTAARGIDHVFDAMFGLEQAGYAPKPAPEAYDRVFSKAAITPTSSAFFEDELRNLKVPKSLGVTTVLVGPSEPAPFVDFHIDDLVDFLSRIPPSPFSQDETAPKSNS